MADSRKTNLSEQVCITGATGFLGRAVVHAAVQAGYRVVALVRFGQAHANPGWDALAGVRVVEVDMNDLEQFAEALSGSDAVIHIAAAKSGSYAEQYSATVALTERLFAAMKQASIRRLVGVGSFSVFDYDCLANGDLLHDDSALEVHPALRDAYTETKLQQEKCFDAFGASGGLVTLLRPGIIYGPSQVWQFCLGRALGRGRWLHIGPDCDELPLTYVDNCADAIVAALGAPLAVGASINIVDDERPGRAEFIAKLNSCPSIRKSVVRLPWRILFSTARLIRAINHHIFSERLPVPGLLRPRALNARFKPLRYSNAMAKELLGWQPRVSVDVALERCAREK